MSFVGYRLPCALLTILFDIIGRRYVDFLCAVWPIVYSLPIFGYALYYHWSQTGYYKAILEWKGVVTGCGCLGLIVIQVPLQMALVLFAHSRQIPQRMNYARTFAGDLGYGIVTHSNTVYAFLYLHFPELFILREERPRHLWVFLLVLFPTYFFWLHMVSKVLHSCFAVPWVAFVTKAFDKHPRRNVISVLICACILSCHAGWRFAG
jgi:hypothetical protein